MKTSLVRSFVSAAAGLLALVASASSAASAVTIGYELNASAVVPSRYEYHYTITNDSLPLPLSWFSIDFDTTLYDESSLLITSVGLGDWSEQILGSVLANPAQYDAYQTAGTALGIGESAAGFTVEFTWLGVGTPGSQAFTIYDAATLDVLDSGRTTALDAPPPPIPEPSTAALTLLALCGVAAATRRKATWAVSSRTA